MPVASATTFPKWRDDDFSNAARFALTHQGGEQSEVITRLVPLPATATSRPLPQVTEYRPLACAAVHAVHVMPSGEWQSDERPTSHTETWGEDPSKPW